MGDPVIYPDKTPLFELKNLLSTLLSSLFFESEKLLSWGALDRTFTSEGVMQAPDDELELQYLTSPSTTTITWTPSIGRAERVLKATVEQLTTFLKVNVPPEELRSLAVSSMNKLELQRHCLAIATKGRPSPQLLHAAELALCPYAKMSRDALLDLAFKTETLEAEDEDDPAYDCTKKELIELLAENRGTNKLNAVRNLWRIEAERQRRSITTECLVALSQGLGPFRFLQEAKHFLHWAWADTQSFRVADELVERMEWMQNLSHFECDWTQLREVVIRPRVAYVRRHVLPFVRHMPWVLPVDLVTFINLQLSRALPAIGVSAAQNKIAKDKVVETTFDNVPVVTANPPTPAPFFTQDLLDNEQLAKLRVPQKEALEALRQHLVGFQGRASAADEAIAQYKALSHLRIWFNDVLRKLYDGRQLSEQFLKDGARYRAALVARTLEQGPAHPLMIVLPTGVGKSLVMCYAPFLYKARRVLVISPNVHIREQLLALFRDHYALAGFPTAPVVAFDVEHGNADADVFVCNNQRLRGDTLLRSFPRDYFSLVLVDEAHHAEAFTYRLLREHFHTASFLFLTATPFRGDEKDIDATTIYSCSMTDAIKAGYIKNICYLPVPIHSANLVALPSGRRGERTRNGVSGEQLALLSDEVYRAVISSDECKQVVMSLAMKKMRELRALPGNVRHQIIAQAIDQDDARDLVYLWQHHPENDGAFTVDYVGSSRSLAENVRVLQELKAQSLDIIIHVGMLGEGFDHPFLSICCIFRRFASFAPYAQFVGRVLRRIRDVDDSHNQAFIIAHPGLGLQRHWDLYVKDNVDAILDDITISYRSRPGIWTDIVKHKIANEIEETWFVSK